MNSSPNHPDYYYDHGDHIAFMFGNMKDEDIFRKKVGASIEMSRRYEGIFGKNNLYVLTNNDSQNILSQLIFLEKKDSHNEFAGSIPLIRTGISTPVKIVKIRKWDNINFEANARALIGNGVEIGFYIPFFAKEHSNIRENTWYYVDLSAVIIRAEKSKLPKYMSIDKGPLFLKHKEEYLKDNPGCDENDVPPCELSMENFSMFNELDHFPDHYQFLGKICNPVFTELLGRKFCVFESSVSCQSANLNLTLCANVEDSKELSFSDGEGVEAIAWLQGSNFRVMDKTDSSIYEDEISGMDSIDSNMDRFFRFEEILTLGWPQAMALVCASLPDKFSIVELHDNNDYETVEVSDGVKNYKINIASNINGTKGRFTEADISTLHESERENCSYINFHFTRNANYLSTSYEDVFNFEKIFGKPKIPIMIRDLDNANACSELADAINLKNFSFFRTNVVKHLHYKSYWGNKEFNNADDTFSHLNSAFLSLKDSKTEIFARTGTVNLKGEIFPCVIISQGERDKIANITIPLVRYGKIREILVLPVSDYNYSIDRKHESDKYVSIADYDSDLGSTGTLEVNDVSVDGSKHPMEGSSYDTVDIDKLLRLAEENNAEAQYTLGRLYRAGSVLDQDYSLAETFLRKAADQNFSRAVEELEDIENELDGYIPKPSQSSIVVDENGEPKVLCFPKNFDHVKDPLMRDMILASAIAEYYIDNIKESEDIQIKYSELTDPQIRFKIRGAEFNVIVRSARFPSYATLNSNDRRYALKHFKRPYLACVEIMPAGIAKDGREEFFINYRGLEKILPQ